MTHHPTDSLRLHPENVEAFLDAALQAETLGLAAVSDKDRAFWLARSEQELRRAINAERELDL